MFGEYSNFKCPCCGYYELIDLGITKLINIKGVANSLAINKCQKCNKNIAFEMSEPSLSMYHKFKGNTKVINFIENTINNFSNEELNNEEELKNKVMSDLKSIITQDYIDKYYVELIEIIEIYSAIKTNPMRSYDISEYNKDDIENAGVICF
jgi:hypothetical protein